MGKYVKARDYPIHTAHWKAAPFVIVQCPESECSGYAKIATVGGARGWAKRHARLHRDYDTPKVGVAA